MFGAEFDEASLVGEDRLTVEEWATGPTGRVPLLDRVTEALRGCTSHEAQLREGVRLFGPDENTADLDPQAMGEWLRAHPFTHRLLQLTAEPVLADRPGGPGRAELGGHRRRAARGGLATPSRSTWRCCRGPATAIGRCSGSTCSCGCAR